VFVGSCAETRRFRPDVCAVPLRVADEEPLLRVRPSRFGGSFDATSRNDEYWSETHFARFSSAAASGLVHQSAEIALSVELPAPIVDARLPERDRASVDTLNA
jgi:hypothetical protein